MPLGKNRTQRVIDATAAKRIASGDATDVIEQAPTRPAAPTPRTPENLSASTGIAYSDRSALAYANLYWDAPRGSTPTGYVVQMASDAGFTTGLAEFDVPAPALDGSPSAYIGSLKTKTTYYARVKAKNYQVISGWSDAISFLTPEDTNPPGPITGGAATLGLDGNLFIAGTTPSDDNFAAVQIRIRASAGGTIYTTEQLTLQPGRAFRWTWSAAENVRLSGGDGTLVIEVATLNWSGYASTPVTLTATKDAPTTPSVAVAWDAASGTATWTWSSVAFETYTLIIDGAAREAQTGYAYTATQNRKEHSGTADPSLTWSLTALDPLGQPSAPASGTTTLSPPANPTGATTTWSRGSGILALDWADVAGANSYIVAIDSKERPALFSAYEYSPPLNRLEHSGAAANSVAWSVWAVDGLGQRSATPATGTASLPRPDTPTVTTDFRAADARWSWTLIADCTYRLTIDGKARDLMGLGFEYLYAQNAEDHGGTATPSLPWALVAVDGLGQTSATPASGTLVNAAPGAVTAISLTPGATGFVVGISYPETLDFRDFTVRIIKNGATLETLTRTASDFAYMAQANGSYQVGVIVNDRFGQASTEYVTPSAVSLDILTTAELRADCIYRDSAGTSSATLAALKDDADTPVVTYAAGSAWASTEAVRATAYRVGNIVITASGGVGYIGISPDGATYSFYAGPLGSDGQTLTAYASEALAQSNALALPAAHGRWTIPTMASVRYIKLGHRNVGGTYSLAEFYPPTLVVVDNLRADMIRGMTIVGNQMVTDRLSALSAYLGAVDISGVCTIGSAGGIWQGSAGTFAAPTTGFKLYQSATGKGLWETWLAGVKQVYIGDDMALYAGAGSLRLNQLGMRLYAGVGSSADPSSSLRWYRSQSDADSAWLNQIYFEPNLNTLYQISAPPTSAGGAHTIIRSQRQPGPSFSTVYAEIDWRGGDSSRNPRLSAQARANTGSNTGTWDLTPVGMLVEGAGGGDGFNEPQGALDVLGDLYASGSFYGTDFRTPSSTDILTLGIDGATSDAFYADATNNTYINAIGANGLVQLRVAGATKAYADKNGNFTASNAFFPGGQGTYYLYYDAATFGTATNNNFKAGGNITAGNDLSAVHDIYLGTRSTWLSGWLSQAVKQTDTPIFAGVMFADTDTGIVNGGDGRAIIKGNNVNMAAWLGAGSYPGIYVDLANNCTSDTINWGLRFGAEGSGEGISGPRAGTNQYGVTIWTGYTARMQIGSNGNVSIGTSFAPTADKRLAVRGTDATSSNYALFVQNGSAVNLFYVRNDGYVWSVTAVQTSDRRLKKNIRYLDEEESDRILDLAPVEYTLRMNERRMYGHIAQDVRSIYELLVAEGDQGMLGIHESGILALAVLRIQQHERRIDRLEARLAALEAAA